jgi:hypothetical protein
VLNKPYILEFGADAFNVINKSEDQKIPETIICWVIGNLQKMLPA